MPRKNPLSQHAQFAALYLDLLLEPWYWEDKADKMLEGSKILEPKLRAFWSVVLTNAEEGRYDKGSEPPNKPPSDLHDPYFILVSYALEDLFKAIII